MNETVSLSRLYAEQRVLVTAHRGNTLEAPENTLPAMQKAVEAGTDFIEFVFGRCEKTVSIKMIQTDG